MRVLGSGFGIYPRGVVHTTALSDVHAVASQPVPPPTCPCAGPPDTLKRGDASKRPKLNPATETRVPPSVGPLTRINEWTEGASYETGSVSVPIDARAVVKTI